MAGKGKIENLRPPWKPGESGNPSGRPRRTAISEIYAELLEMPLPEELRNRLKRSEGITFVKALALGVLEKALDGNLAAVREVREATEGKANVRPNTIEREVEVHIVYEDPVKKRSDENQATPNVNENQAMTNQDEPKKEEDKN
jgi:hypothetical protein